MSSELNILKESWIDQEKIDRFLLSQSINQLILSALQIAFSIARSLLEQELSIRAEKPSKWPACPHCGGRLESKGRLPRSLLTPFGIIHWSRPVGRCSQGCNISQIVPLDQELGIAPRQMTASLLKEIACLLAVFMPYRISALVFEKLWGISIADNTIWAWVQEYGKSAMDQLEEEIQRHELDGTFVEDDLSPSVLKLKCLLGADGVFAPFRPYEGSPKGKVVWKEVKIGVITRLKHRLNRSGETVTQLVQRKLVAVLGDVSAVAKRLSLESRKQQVSQASAVIWISDGGRWLWRIYQTYFALYALGVLDFYHSAQNLWKGTAAWLDGRTTKARLWFAHARRRLRYGDAETVLLELEDAIKQECHKENKETIQNLTNYLTTHLQHIQYYEFKQQNIPIGSGFVESACKWLIQQRFKCVGMRWSEQGFSHLLHLRLLWVNGRWESFFLDSPIE